MDASLQRRAEQLATEFASQASTAEDLNGLMRTMMKTALERMLNTEMDVHLGRRTNPAIANMTLSGAEALTACDTAVPTGKNRRNGHSRKTVSGDMGDINLQTPRDRN